MSEIDSRPWKRDREYKLSLFFSCVGLHYSEPGRHHFAGGRGKLFYASADLPADYRDRHVLARWIGQVQVDVVEGPVHSHVWSAGLRVRDLHEFVAFDESGSDARVGGGRVKEGGDNLEV